MRSIPDTGIDLPLVPTSIPGLDNILYGGLRGGGLYLVTGSPGSGKTILGNQMAFSHVAAGGRAVYVTLLAETQARMLSHLRQMEFFNPAVVANTLYYISGYKTLEESGLKGLLDLLRRVIRTRKATLLVIDGLVTAQFVAESDLAFKQFFHELQVFVEAVGCTVVLLSPLTDEFRPRIEYTMVDGVILMSTHAVSQWTQREVEVTKLRGSNFLRGRHFYDITQAGLTVWPRTESILGKHPTGERLSDRRGFGVTRLDEMLQGGVIVGSSTMVLGAPGSGKTLLGLHYLAEGARRGERGLYFGFYETPSQIISKADAIRLGFRQHIDAGLIDLIWKPPGDFNVDEIASELLMLVRRSGVKRLFIDSFRGFLDAAVYPERVSRFYAALVNELRNLSVTTVFSLETARLFARDVEVPVPSVEDRVDNIIFLRYVELYSQLYRLISIFKVRDSGYETTIREFQITDTGIEVAATFTSAEAILTGVARPLGPLGEQPGREPGR